MDQYKCPTGDQSKVVAASMKQRHNELSIWALKKVMIKSNFFILDIGCEGGKTINRLAHQVVQGKVFGIGQSADIVNHSRKENKELITENRVSVVEGSVEKTSFPDSFFFF